MPVLLPEERKVEIPELFLFENNLERDSISDVAGVVDAQMNIAMHKIDTKPGMRVAIAVGSRGIGKLPIIIASIIRNLKSKNLDPFIVSAMGSHGGGTERGQLQILEKLGITSKTMGVRVVAKNDVVKIGNISTGESVFFDSEAYNADGVILVNRIKPHTDFDGDGKIESGLCKMSVIGLGNHRGCVSMHRAGIERFPDNLIEASKIVFKKTNVMFGIGIVENAIGEPYQIEAILPESLHEREPELLKLAKEKMAKIPFPNVDILVVDEIGKDISGSGMDPNIVGRLGPKKNSKLVPNISYIIALSVSEKSNGNATGVGFADLITEKLFRQINFEDTYANCLAGGSEFGLQCAKIPPIMKSEHDAMLMAMKLWNGKDPQQCKIVRIKNTKDLNKMLVSKASYMSLFE